MIVNMNMHSDGEGAINEYLCDTICRVFDNVYTADVGNNTNRELFACNKHDCEKLLQFFLDLSNDSDNADFDRLVWQLKKVARALTRYEQSSKAYVLTDDKAPVELLGMSMIDSIISEELEYYQGIFHKEGIKGLIDRLL